MDEKTSLLRPKRGANGNGDISSRDLEQARLAYSARDSELSKSAHQAKRGNVEPGHQSEGDYIKSVVFGGLDGILTTFAIVSGATGGGLSAEVVLILGFSSKIADALAMGLGDALSQKAEHEHIFQERQREYWEYDNYPEGEVAEMVDMYVARGMERQDAEKVIRIMSKHRHFFVDVMMVEELGLQVPDEDANPWFDGFITFCSFIFFGFFPLLGYCIFPFAFPHLTANELFAIACVLTGCTLFVLGAVKSNFSYKSWFRSGVEMLLVGGMVAFVAFLLGYLTNQWFGVDPDELELSVNGLSP